MLEARSQLWHIDRVTHEVTVSDVLVGEDGERSSPRAMSSMTASRCGSISRRCVPSRSTAKCTGRRPAAVASMFLPSSVDHTFTGDGLMQDWPKAGSNVGGGWEVEAAAAVDIDGIGKIADDAYSQVGPAGSQHRVEDGRLVPS